VRVSPVASKGWWIVAASDEICVIMNSGSGRRDEDEAEGEIREAFTGRGLPLRLVQVNGPRIGVEARAAVARGHQMIVAAGGDGTIAAVASVLRGTGRTMGILPLGTFNYFARSLDLPTEMPEAVAILADGTARLVRLATINERLFLNNASLGAYPAILKNREDVYRRWGRSRLAAYWSVLKTLATLRQPLHLRITANGETRFFRTPLVFAVNNVFQLDQIGLEGGDEVAAGKLVLFVAPDTGRWGMLRHTIELAVGTAEKNRNFELIAASEIHIEAGGRQRHVACDGERERMSDPYQLRVVENELTVMVPQAQAESVR
jgi:diacylglycerol kinase family enzyme